MFDAPGQFERVTREQVQAVAREILDRSKRTVGVLVPVSEDEAETASGA